MRHAKKQTMAHRHGGKTVPKERQRLDFLDKYFVSVITNMFIKNITVLVTVDL